MRTFIYTKVDYDNAANAGLPLSRMSQSLKPRLIIWIEMFGLTSNYMREKLRWLQMRRRIEFKISMLKRCCLASCAPSALRQLGASTPSLIGCRSLHTAA